MPIFPNRKAILAAAQDGRISASVEIRLKHMVEEDEYGFTTLLAEEMIGKKLALKLINFEYSITDHTADTLTLAVSADIRLLLTVPSQEDVHAPSEQEVKP